MARGEGGAWADGTWSDATYAAAQIFCAGFTYKPGCRLVAARDVLSGNTTLRLDMMVLDSRDPTGTKQILVGQWRSINPLRACNDLAGPVAYVQEVAWKMILDAERHEAAEWFRVDGLLPYDPHQEEAS